MSISVVSSLETSALTRSLAYLFPFPGVDVVMSGCGMLASPHSGNNSLSIYDSDRYSNNLPQTPIYDRNNPTVFSIV
jgi:hypothetical protein